MTEEDRLLGEWIARADRYLAERDEARAERDEARKWLRFIADTQHRLLDAIRNEAEVTDEEWAAFAEALELNR